MKLEYSFLVGSVIETTEEAKLLPVGAILQYNNGTNFLIVRDDGTVKYSGDKGTQGKLDRIVKATWLRPTIKYLPPRKYKVGDTMVESELVNVPPGTIYTSNSSDEGVRYLKGEGSLIHYLGVFDNIKTSSPLLTGKHTYRLVYVP